MSTVDKNGTAPSNQFKLLVTGPPNGGKTSLVHRLIQSSEQPTKGRTKVHFCKITDPHRWREMDFSSQLTVLSQRYQNTKVPLSTVDVNITKPAASLSTAKNSHISVVIFDIDGDDCNCELLPLLLTPQDIVLLVYNASEVLANKSFGSLDYFLKSVCFHCSVEVCRSDLNSHHWPRIVMVGTHADLLTPKDKSDIDVLFRNYSRGKLFSKHFESLCFIDCIKGRKYHLQDTILSAAKLLCNKRCPLAYFEFEYNILQLRHTQIHIKKEEVLAIANQFGITVGEPLLKYCRNKGIILYYPTTESLQDDIFIFPCKIINLLSFMLAENNPRVMVLGMSLRDRFAQLSDSRKKLVVYLLQNFLFSGRLSAIQNTTIGFRYENDTILMPLLLKWCNATVNCDHAEIIYFFPDKFLPKCVFHQLLANTVDWCYIGNHKIVRLYSNHGQFSFGNWQQFYLDYSTKYITCSVALPPDKAAEEEENMYPDLLVFLQETLNKICALCLPSAQRPVGHLKCPLDHTGVQYHLHLPLDKISGENELICSVTKKPVPKKYYASLVKINCTRLDDSKEKEAYALALKEGKAKPSSVRIVAVGTENAGKTCLIESLLGEDFKHHDATQGADVNVCKIFSTNWSRQKNDQFCDKLQRNFCSQWKATADRKSLGEDEVLDCDEPASRASSPEIEESWPTIAITPADETQPGSSSNLSLPFIDEEELPVVSDADLKGVELSSPVSENEINAVIWDVSGQTVYHGLLSPFLTEDNVTLVVFNASQNLLSVPKPRSDQYTEDSISPKMTGCEIICYWLNSIYSYCHKRGTKWSLSRCLPTVFLVATHIDLIGDSEAIKQKKEEIISLLASAFEGKPFAGLLAGNRGGDGIMEALKKYLFFISNKERDPAVFMQLKEALVEASQHLLIQRHPVVYIRIERHLLDLNKDSITTSEFNEIARICGFPVNFGSNKFYGALQYFHRKGIALHFHSVKSLKNVVILSPQWLVKLLAYVIVGHAFKPIGSTLDKQYDCLIKWGILHKEFSDHMVKSFNAWQTSTCSGIKIDSEQAMDFVEKFNFVAEIDSSTVFLNGLKRYSNLAKLEDKLYIVPSMLPEEIPETSGDALFQKIIRDRTLDDSEDKDVRVVYFNFPDGFVPIAVFSQVLATCIKRNADRSEDVMWLGRYHCKLVLGEDQFYYVILHKTKESICLVFSPDESGTVGIIGVKERLKLFEKFHDNLLSSLKAVAKSLKNPIPYIPCPLCDYLHLNLDIIRGKSKRLLRCSTMKISPDYYSDFRETADEEDSSPHESPQPSPRKKVKLSSESVSRSSGDVQSSTGDVQNMSSSEKKGGCPTLSEWLSCLKDVTKWKSFAGHLLPSDSAVAEIDVIDRNCRGDVDECKRELYSTFTRLGERTWTKVVEALEKSFHINIAKEIIIKFRL